MGRGVKFIPGLVIALPLTQWVASWVSFERQMSCLCLIAEHPARLSAETAVNHSVLLDSMLSGQSTFCSLVKESAGVPVRFNAFQAVFSVRCNRADLTMVHCHLMLLQRHVMCAWRACVRVRMCECVRVCVCVDRTKRTTSWSKLTERSTRCRHGTRQRARQRAG